MALSQQHHQHQYYGTQGHGEARSTQGPSAEEWEALKTEIGALYEKHSLKHVRYELETRYGFRATERMYKARLSTWGFSKNLNFKEYQACAVLHKTRKENGKKSSAFVIHGNNKSYTDLRKFIKGRKMSEEAFLAAAAQASINVDQYDVRAYTPDPESEAEVAKNTPSESSSNDMPVVSPTKTFLLSPQSPTFDHELTRQLSSERPSSMQSAIASLQQHRITPSRLESTDSSSSAAATAAASALVPRRTASQSYPGIRPTNAWDSRPSTADMSSTDSCGQLGQEIEMMSYQTLYGGPLTSRYPDITDIETWRLMSSAKCSDTEDYVTVCGKCHDPKTSHFVSLRNLYQPQRPRSVLNENADNAEDPFLVPRSQKEYDHPCKWVARCYSACIYSTSGNLVMRDLSLKDADFQFEQMIRTKEPRIIIALNQCLTVLHMHDQGEICKLIMSSAHRVADRVLGPHSAITVTTKWMTYVASLELKKCEITNETLNEVYSQFVHDYGKADLRSIGALYNYGFMLNFERDCAAAEIILRQVYKISCEVLGKDHMQSVSAYTNLSRALDRQERPLEAIEVLWTAIEDSCYTLGPNHPRRLESIRMLALLYAKTDQKEKMEPLYWQVLVGRVKMLGRDHEYTRAMKLDLEDYLKEMEKWQEGGPDAVRIHDLFEWDPNEKWSTRGRTSKNGGVEENSEGSSRTGSEISDRREAF